mmetsp:Transcript_14740/g.34959  ORF Transcript_14740/g.34959 Transcript_14740/m.34959 type:complete len:207 (-) Transcript_14740:480-1100(-)
MAVPSLVLYLHVTRPASPSVRTTVTTATRSLSLAAMLSSSKVSTPCESLSWMVTSQLAAGPMRAPLLGSESSTKKCSVPSTSSSSMIGMRMVCCVWPRWNSTRPDTASKSMPAVAVPLTVSNCTEIVSACGAPVTWISRSRNFSFSFTLTPTLTNWMAGFASACACPALPPPVSASVGAALACALILASCPTMSLPPVAERVADTR